MKRPYPFLVLLLGIVVACAGPSNPSPAPTPSATAVAVAVAPSDPATRPTPRPTQATATPRSTQRPTPSPSPTPTPTPTPSPTATPSATPASTPTPTATPAATPTATPTATPESTPRPSAKPDPTPDGGNGLTLLGAWTVRFTPGVANGNGANIRVPAQRIDGTKIKPGGQFNFVDEVGPITSPPYEMGGVIKNGRIDEDGALSGGMCSAATAMFNAALRAGLQITERHNHSLYISRYPVGLDATIYNRFKTVRFVNDTGHPILIRGIPGKRKVRFEIWGVDDGRKVALSKPTIENVREAPRYIEYSDKLAPGERKRTDDPYDAFQSWVTRTVRDAGGDVMHKETYYSRYRQLAGVVEVGRYPGDPAAGTRILASEYPH